jgi:hypothetical protein
MRSRNAFPECFTERGIVGLPRVPVPRSAFRETRQPVPSKHTLLPGAGLRRKFMRTCRNPHPRRAKLRTLAYFPPKYSRKDEVGGEVASWRLPRK